MLAARRMMNMQPIDPCLHDTFDRANAATPNPASDGGSWTVYAGTWGISANHLNNQLFSNWSSGGSGSNTNGPDPMGSDQFLARDFGHAAMAVTVTVHHSGADSATAWIALNFDPTTRGAYLLEVGPVAHRVWRAPSNVAASRVLLATLPMTVSSPGTTTVGFEHDGAGNFIVVQDGTVVGAFSDAATPLAGTWAGLGITSNMDTANYFDDFEVCPNLGLPAFVDVHTAQHPFGFSSIDIGIPTGAVGDLLILIHSGFNDTSDPTGWTAIPDILASGTTLNCRLSVWTRVADGTEGSSVNLTDSGDNDVGACLRYTRVGSYTDTTWSSTNVADSVTTPTATANAGDIVLSVWAWEEINTSAALTVTTDAAVTARVPKVQWDQACLAVGDEYAAASGTTTGRTATATNSTSGASRCAMTMVLKP